MSAWHHIVPLRTVEGLFSMKPNANPVWTQAHWQETGNTLLGYVVNEADLKKVLLSASMLLRERHIEPF